MKKLEINSKSSDGLFKIYILLQIIFHADSSHIKIAIHWYLAREKI